MTEIAHTNGIRRDLFRPAGGGHPWAPGLQPSEKIIRLNAMLKAYAGSTTGLSRLSQRHEG